MKNFDKLKKLLSPKDGKAVHLALVKAEVNGKEARTQGVGERDSVVNIGKDGRVVLLSGRQIRRPDDDSNVELSEDGRTFTVTRNASGAVEVLHFEIYPEQETGTGQKDMPIVTRATQSYQPELGAHPTPLRGDDAVAVPQEGDGDPAQGPSWPMTDEHNLTPDAADTTQPSPDLTPDAVPGGKPSPKGQGRQEGVEPAGNSPKETPVQSGMRNNKK